MSKFKEHEEVAKKHGISGGDWMNLQVGDNKIRIVSEVEDYGDHYDALNKKRVPCLGEENCYFCKKRKELIDAGKDPKSKEIQALRIRVQFLFWVIDRSDNQVKLLRTGYQVYEQVGKLAKSEEYGFDVVPDYDMTINRAGEGLETKYSVIPSRKAIPLTLEEEARIREKAKSLSDIIDKMKAKVAFADNTETLEDAEEVE